jgi:hypothetical protein
MALQPFVRLSPISPIYNNANCPQEFLDSGSARPKASSYTKDNAKSE